VKEGEEKETGDELEAGVVKEEDIKPLDLGQKLRSIWMSERESDRERSGGNFKERDNEGMEPLLHYLFILFGFSALPEMFYFNCGLEQEEIFI
jgi:hypothetical protein